MQKRGIKWEEVAESLITIRSPKERNSRVVLESGGDWTAVLTGHLQCLKPEP